MRHNKQHLFYIVMDETSKFTSHICDEPRSTPIEKKTL